jgi:hypothetical protein
LIETAKIEATMHAGFRTGRHFGSLHREALG